MINLGLYKNITILGLNRVNLPPIYEDSVMNPLKCRQRIGIDGEKTLRIP